MKISDRLLAGMMFAYTENKGDFGGEGGGFKLRQPVFTLYGGYGEGPWYRRRDVRRREPRLQRHQPQHRPRPARAQRKRPDARLRIHGAAARRLLVQVPGLAARPVRARDLYQGDRPAVLRNRRGQHGAHLRPAINEQMLWSVGWQVAGKFGSVRPWARATWEYDSLDKDRTVTASSNTLGGSYTRARDQSRTTTTRCSMSAPPSIGRRHRLHLGFGHRRRAATATTGPSPSACACRSDARHASHVEGPPRWRPFVLARRSAGSTRARGFRGACANSAIVERTRQSLQHPSRRPPFATAARRSGGGARSRAQSSGAARSAFIRNGIGYGLPAVIGVAM